MNLSDMKRLSGDYHTHSIYDDGKSTLLEMALSAERAGLDYLGFSGHACQPFGEEYCIAPERVRDYVAEARQLQKQFLEEGHGLRLFVGLELDIYGRPEEDLDYVIGSAHGIMADGRLYNVDESPETTGRLIDEVFSGDAYAMTRAYYDNVAKIPRLTGCSIIGHFDLVTKFNEKQPMFDEQDKRYLDAALSVMEYLVKQDMIFEINTGAISRGWRTEPYPDMRLLRALYDMGGRIMLNSDSHHRDTVAYGFELAKRRAKEAGFSSSVLLTESGFLETAL